MSKRPQMIAVALIALASASFPAAAEDTYGQAVGQKLGSALSNLVLGWWEIPKNVILLNNQDNAVAGVAGGTVRGVLHTIGRAGSGVLDLLTFPLPTKPITQPAFVWQNFGIETRYGPIFKLQDTQDTQH
jgi:putative exosortase-associated protein (TIGR04073 family)